MANIDILKQMLIDGHPVTLSDYTGTPEAVATEMNVLNISANADDIDDAALLETVNEIEYDLLSADERQTVEMVLRLSRIDPNGMGIILFKSAFGAGTTFDAVVALSQKTISHATQEGIGQVKPGHIEQARA